MRYRTSLDTLRDLGVTGPLAEKIMAQLADDESRGDRSAVDVWVGLTNTSLTPDVPFPAHFHLFEAVYAEWDDSQGPPPAWVPAPAEVERSNIMALCRRVGLSSPERLHSWSIDDRERFWTEISAQLGIRFIKEPATTLRSARDTESPDWFPGARLNIAQSCFCATSGEWAIIYQSEGGKLGKTTYGELDGLSNRVAVGLGDLGLRTGDAVAIDMPMTVEAVAAYLGIVKAGCVVVSIADSFAKDEIATRLRIAAAKAVFTQDVIHRAGKTLPMYQKVVDAGAPLAIVVPTGDALQVTIRGGDHEWNAWLDGISGEDVVVAPCQPDDATNVLFSSGTTGEPKAIPWSHTTPIKCAMDGWLHHDIHQGDVVAWPTNIGWMMGPWLIYASLVNRATMALYYGAPGSREFCEFVQNAGVTMLGVVPSLVRAWRDSGAAEGLDWTSIKLFSSTGEASNAEDYLYLMALAGYRPVIEYCGGTEVGGGYITGTLVRPASPATFSSKSYGLDFCLLDEDGKVAKNGEIFIVPPSIGLSTRLLNKDHHEVYYEGLPSGPKGELLRRHGDQMEELPNGYYRAHGRADDTMNLGGIKVSSAEIERVVAGVEGVAESAAIAVAPSGGGPSLLVVYVVPRSGPAQYADADPAELKLTLQTAISRDLNPLFRLHDVVLIDSLPRTASNKVMRRVLRDRYEPR